MMTAFFLLSLMKPALAKENICGHTPHIILDIGHSPKVGGSTSARGKSEYSFNRRFVMEFAQKLRSDTGFYVKILNPEGHHLSLGARARQIRRLKRGILLSIHHDSMQKQFLSTWFYKGKRRLYGDRYSGYSLFISSRAPSFSSSKKLALSIGEIFNRVGLERTLHHAEPIPGENKPTVHNQFGVFLYDGLAILKRTHIPAVLVEVGVILNRDEEQALNEKKYRNIFFDALIMGIEQFCKSEN